jgi:LysR family nitrogen assimilation transcriptional regulator
VFYNEALAVLRHLERIPGIVRSAGGEAEGIVTIGMSSTLAASLAGPLMEECRRALPRVALRFVTSDSLDLRARIDNHTLDLAIVFEDHAVSGYLCTPLYRQRLFLISRDRRPRSESSISVQQMATLPLVLPSPPNLVRALVDRVFAQVGIRPNIAAETDVFSGMLSAIVAGVGSGVLPRGDFTDLPGQVKLWAQLIEPALFVTASIVASSEVPLTRAGEEVRNVISQFIVERQLLAAAPGVEPLPVEP